MAQILQHRRFTTIELAAERGSAGEFMMDKSKNTLVVMDGTTLGGHPLAKESAIPVNVSQLTNDAGYITSAAVFSGDYNDLTNKPTLFNGSYNSLTDKPTLFDGQYSSLTGTPVIPSAVSQLTNDSNYATVAQIPTDVGDLNNNVAYVTYTLMTNTINSSLTNYATDGDVATAVAPKIELDDLSVGPLNAPSGAGAISYNNTTGIFNFTPPDLSTYITAVVDDPAPQIQGDLITNGRKIKTTSGDLTLESAGDVVVNGTINPTGGIEGYISVTQLKSLAASANTYAEFATAIANL